MHVKGIQVLAEVHYDDGTVCVMATPVYKKDIRHGDLFPDDQAASVLRHGAKKIIRTFRKIKGAGLYKQAKRRPPKSGG